MKKNDIGLVDTTSASNLETETEEGRKHRHSKSSDKSDKTTLTIV